MKRKTKKPWLFSAPALALIGIIVIFPIIYTGYISLTNMNLFHWSNYSLVGMENYKRALFKVDSGFLKALITTVIWTIVNMILQIFISYMIAVGLNVNGLKAKRIYKTLLIFPWAMPAYVSILVWRVGIYNTEFGLFNHILSAVTGRKIDLLAQNTTAFIACLVLNLWMALPFMIMMMDGALQSVDQSLYESAVMEGANWYQKNRYITIPSIKRILAPAVIMTTFTTFKQFDILYLLTMQKGSLTGSTLQTIITYAHQNAFVSNNYGLSSAVSMLIFVMIIIFSCITNRSIKEET